MIMGFEVPSFLEEGALGLPSGGGFCVFKFRYHLQVVFCSV